jgi:hypothetical protein
MAKAEIMAGVCGFHTTVVATQDGEMVKLDIHSDCKSIMKMAAGLVEVDPLREISFHGEGPLVLQAAVKACRHPSCPVPAGILKAAEVAAGLALPVDATIHIEKGNDQAGHPNPGVTM